MTDEAVETHDAAVRSSRPALTARLSRKAQGIPSLLKRAWRQPTIASTGMFALSGGAFALGNLTLARVLPVEDFGRFALAMSLFNIFVLIAPIGIDQAVLRHRIDPGPPLLLLLLVTSTLTALVVAIGSVMFEGLRPDEALALAAALIPGSIMTFIAAVLRAAGQQFRAIIFATAPNWLILLIGIMALLMDFRQAIIPLWLLAGGSVLSALPGCQRLLRRHRVPANQRVSVDWYEAASLLGIAAVSTISLQLERVVTPIVLDLRALATFGVLASIAIFPFRLVTAGVGFALTPRLKAAANRQERLKLIQTELRLALPFLALMSAAIIITAPALVSLLTRGQYAIDIPLVAAACVNGSVKVITALNRAVLTGCGTSRQLSRLNLFNILGLVAAVIGGQLCGRYGLTGILLGISAGTLLAALPAFGLALRSLANESHPQIGGHEARLA